MLMKYHSIPYPKRKSEFEIQAQLYYELKKNRINVRGEVKAHKSRLDLVVYDKDDKPQCIIEVKARARLRKQPRKYKQIIKYEELFGLPIIICLNKTQVSDTINEVRKVFNAC